MARGTAGQCRRCGAACTRCTSWWVGRGSDLKRDIVSDLTGLHEDEGVAGEGLGLDNDKSLAVSGNEEEYQDVVGS